MLLTSAELSRAEITPLSSEHSDLLSGQNFPSGQLTHHKPSPILNTNPRWIMIKPRLYQILINSAREPITREVEEHEEYEVYELCEIFHTIYVRLYSWVSYSYSDVEIFLGCAFFLFCYFGFRERRHGMTSDWSYTSIWKVYSGLDTNPLQIYDKLYTQEIKTW